ncbi:MAG: ABC transporter permease, partial [Thermomicrobiales bacterium]|nr:ABC transporter permease [Thermomicrobiales bacterium]
MKPSGLVPGRPQGRAFALGPVAVWYIVFFLIPLALMLRYSFAFTEQSRIHFVWTLENYRQVFEDSIYLRLLVRSLKLSLTVTGITLLIGYPAAWAIARMPDRHKPKLLALLIVPWWASYIVRIFGMRMGFGNTGIINSTLKWLGLTDKPLEFFQYNFTAVALTEANLYLPLMIIPIYMSVERMDMRIVQAAYSLGSRPVRTFFRVILPLSLPGVLTGCIFVFLPVTGTFIVPSLVGGPNDIVYGNLIASQFGESYNWPLGSALAIALLLLLV